MADEQIICWGTLPNLFALFAFCDILFSFFFLCFVFFFFVVSFFQPYEYCCTLSFLYPQILVFFYIFLFSYEVVFSFRFFVFRCK